MTLLLTSTHAAEKTLYGTSVHPFVGARARARAKGQGQAGQGPGARAGPDIDNIDDVDVQCLLSVHFPLPTVNICPTIYTAVKVYSIIAEFSII